MECYCCLRNVQDLLADVKTPNESPFGEPLKGPIILFGALVEYHLICQKLKQEVINVARRYYQESFLVRELIAWRISKGDFLKADVVDLEKLDASSIYRQRINAKEVFISQKDDEVVFPFTDGTAKLSGRDYEFRVPTLDRTHR